MILLEYKLELNEFYGPTKDAFSERNNSSRGDKARALYSKDGGFEYEAKKKPLNFFQLSLIKWYEEHTLQKEIRINKKTNKLD